MIYSVSRPGLTRVLLDHARQHYGIEPRFLQAARSLDFERDELVMLDEVSGDTYTVGMAPLIAADGAGSVVRRAMTGQLGVRVAEDMLDHGYKELTLAGGGGAAALERNALHIWPRGGFMLIALPNPDRIVHGDVVLASRRATSFATVDGERGRRRSSAQFPDAVPLMPALARDYREPSRGLLGTVHCRPWSRGTARCWSATPRTRSCRSTARA